MRDAHDENDEMIKRIVDELRTLPPVPADATARVLARVDAARRDGSGASALQDDDDVIFFPTSTEEMRSTPTAPSRPVLVGATSDGSRVTPLGRRFVLSLPAAIGYALAATVVGFLIRGAVPRPSGQASPVAGVFTPADSLGRRAAVIPAAVSRRDMQEAPLKVQFVLDARRAKSVAVVGDFNNWDNTATPLERDSTTGIWSTLASIRPGRHVYAFLVDGTVWTLDPNAPRTKDIDYGTEQSVVIVGMR